MPCISSFFNYGLGIGARVAAIYTLILSFPMFAVGCWYLNSYTSRNYWSYQYHYYKYEKMYQMGASYTAFGILFAFSAGSLYVSALKKNHKLSWFWLITSGFAITYFTIRVTVHGFIEGILTSVEQVIIVLSMFIMVYFFLIVCSFAQEIKALQTCNNQVNPTDENTMPNQIPQYHHYPPISTINEKYIYSLQPYQQQSNTTVPMNIQQSTMPGNFISPYLPPLQNNPQSQPFNGYPPIQYPSHNQLSYTTTPTSFPLQSLSNPPISNYPSSAPQLVPVSNHSLVPLLNNNPSSFPNQYNEFHNLSAPTTVAVVPKTSNNY